jgi:RNA-binding protein Luc7-like 2
MDEAKKMLDELMGKTRDLTEDNKRSVRQTHFSDPEVCKDFLCGVCPYSLFTATKSDLGKCPMPICGDGDAEECKRQYEHLSQEEKDKYGYEHKLMQHLERLLQTCDRRVSRNKEKAAEQMAISEGDVVKIAALRTQIQTGIDQCENAAEAGNVDASISLINQADQAKAVLDRIMHSYDDKQIIVCEVSGNFISSKDNDERMRAHFEGKQYMGWKVVRDTVAGLRERRVPSGVPNYRGNSSSTTEGGDRERDRDGRRRRSSSRGNTSSRNRRSSRSRDRDSNRDRDRDRNSNRDRDRDRRREASPRRRSDDRARDRDRDRDRIRR